MPAVKGGIVRVVMLHAQMDTRVHRGSYVSRDITQPLHTRVCLYGTLIEPIDGFERTEI